MEFWREMYETATATRKHEAARALWYKQRAREAERALRMRRNAVVGTVLALASVACLAAWYTLIWG